MVPIYLGSNVTSRIENYVSMSMVQSQKNLLKIMAFFSVPASTLCCLSLNASEMFSVIDNPSQGVHGYADDTQLYYSLNPNCAGEQELEIVEMETAF